MGLNEIRRELACGQVDFGTHLVDKMIAENIELDQILDVIGNGTVMKKEPDERTEGKLTKYTLVRGGIGVVVKDSDVPFVVTAFRGQ
ncbi:hypothetical protein HY522_11735 [bacterium]|nr:hypothetical protein [bacterium]